MSDRTYTRYGKAFLLKWPGFALARDGDYWVFKAPDTSCLFWIRHDNLEKDPEPSADGAGAWVYFKNSLGADGFEAFLITDDLCIAAVDSSPIEKDDDGCSSCWGSGYVHGWGAPCPEGCVA